MLLPCSSLFTLPFPCSPFFPFHQSSINFQTYCKDITHTAYTHTYNSLSVSITGFASWITILFLAKPDLGGKEISDTFAQRLYFYFILFIYLFIIFFEEGGLI